MYEDHKSQKRTNEQGLKQRQRNEKKAVDLRNDEIMRKLERSKNAVEAFQKKKEHEVMLVQEFRRLKEEDIKKLA